MNIFLIYERKHNPTDPEIMVQNLKSLNDYNTFTLTTKTMHYVRMDVKTLIIVLDSFAFKKTFLSK